MQRLLLSCAPDDEVNEYVQQRIWHSLNPLTPRKTQVSPLTEVSILFQEGIVKKNFYERHAYESVDEESLS